MIDEPMTIKSMQKMKLKAINLLYVVQKLKTLEMLNVVIKTIEILLPSSKQEINFIQKKLENLLQIAIIKAM